MLKRVILLTLVVIIAVFSMVSCAEENREYDEEEVLSAAKALIEKSKVLNELYYGEGIAYTDDMNASNGIYFPADDFSVKNFGIETVEDIKTLTRECFTVSLSNIIIGTKLEVVADSSGNQSYVRYYQKYDTLDESKPECIMVNKNAEVLLKDKVTYDYSTLSVKGAEGQTVKVTVAVTVENPDGDVQYKTLEIALLEEEGGWRIDSPTYTRYTNDSYYQDLQK